MWNRCVTVFEAQRSKAISKSSQVFISQVQDNSELRKLSMLDLQQIQKIFVLQKIEIHGNDEIYQKESRSKPKIDSAFDLKPNADGRARRSLSLTKREKAVKPLME